MSALARSQSTKIALARTRDKDATVLAILQAAAVVFSQHGLRAARTDEIASRAGVAKGLLFHYFDNKEQLFEAVLQRAYEPLREVLDHERLPSLPPEEALRSLVEKVLAAMSACPQGPAIFLMESIQNQGEHYRKLGMPSIYRALEEVLRDGIRQGVFRKLNAKHTAINIMGLCSYYYCARNNFMPGERVEDALTPRALALHSREVLALVMAGVQAHSA